MIGSRLNLAARFVAIGLMAGLPFGLGGCASTVSSPERFSDAVKPYDKTLTADQQKAAISDLRGEQAKHDKDQVQRKQDQAEDASAAPIAPASTPASNGH